MSSPASAIDGSDWQAGRIIDDTLFTDADAMSVSEIQAFLNEYVGTGGNGRVAGQCDTNGQATSELGGGTRAQYGAAHSNPAPFTCLKDYYEVPKSSPGPGMPANNYGGKPKPSGARSAARLIWDAAQAYNISPKVLLVKLHTESAGPLTTDDWPFLVQYKYAMGARCPDSGPGGSANCDEDYAGFSIQMMEAAELLRYYLDNMDESWWPYKTPGEVNSILWDVQETGCGASNVFIENSATAALYTYTPYQPNQAALNNLYGTGNDCSAYGNRNFWRDYHDLFGSSYDTPFFKINGDAKVYMSGADGKYYYVSSDSMLEAYGYRSEFNYIRNVNSSYISGKTFDGQLSRLARFEGAQIYGISAGDLHQFPSRELLESYGFAIGEEAELQDWVSNVLTTSAPMASVLRLSDDKPVYYIEDSKKRHITSSQAYTTLGTPAYSTQPSAELDSFFAGLILDGAPVLTAGTTIHNIENDRYGVWNGTALMTLDEQVGDQLRPDAQYYGSSWTISQLPNGAAINSFVKDSSNNYFFLNTNKTKISVLAGQISALGLSTSNFTQVHDNFLASLTTKPYPSLMRSYGTDPIYVVNGNELLRVNSREDLEGLGYSPTQAADVATPVATTFTNNGKLLFKPGRLVRVDSQSAIYIIDSGSRLYIPSKALLEAYGYKSSAVMNITTAGIAHYPISSTILHWYVRDGSGTYWLMSNGQRLKIKPPLSTANYDVSSAITLSTPTILTVPEGPAATKFIRANSTDKIYLISNGQKRWVSSESRFAALGGSSTTITNVSSEYLNSLPTGPNA